MITSGNGTYVRFVKIFMNLDGLTFSLFKMEQINGNMHFEGKFHGILNVFRIMVLPE